MFLICYLLLFLHAKVQNNVFMLLYSIFDSYFQRSHEITPLKRLIQRPEESLKPMKFLAEDLIAALNEEVTFLFFVSLWNISIDRKVVCGRNLLR
jgi:hypothetical protein